MRQISQIRGTGVLGEMREIGEKEMRKIREI